LPNFYMTRSFQEEDNIFGLPLSQQAMSCTSEPENKHPATTDPDTPKIAPDQNNGPGLIRLDIEDSIVIKKATDGSPSVKAQKKNTETPKNFKPDSVKNLPKIKFPDLTDMDAVPLTQVTSAKNINHPKKGSEMEIPTNEGKNADRKPRKQTQTVIEFPKNNRRMTFDFQKWTDEKIGNSYQSVRSMQTTLNFTREVSGVEIRVYFCGTQEHRDFKVNKKNYVKEMIETILEQSLAENLIDKN
jgi:hypothetical protein